MEKMRKNRYLRAVLLASAFIMGCSSSKGQKAGKSDDTRIQERADSIEPKEKSDKRNIAKEKKDKILNPEGMTLESRIAEPAGYLRTKAEPGSLSEFLRDYPLKEDGSPVLLYDGTLKDYQGAHAAVFALPLENEDLQQCADSIIRIYAQYFWETKQYGRIAFHFVNGFYAEYVKWREGFRIRVDGNQAEWIKEGGYDGSYETFCKYLRMVFAYAGTLSMDAESEEVSLPDIRVGDIFLESSNPGHVVMLVDLCENTQGKKAFLLAQGFMPAQEFHILKNPLHGDDPWYYEDEIEFPFLTPEYTFGKGSLRRLNY